MKYIDADKLIAQIDNLESFSCISEEQDGFYSAISRINDIIASLQQENEIVEFTFKGGTYRVNGEEHAFKGGKAKVIILEVNQEEENV
jgi:hypothetical protein